MSQPGDDPWVRAALSDDCVVADVLVRLGVSVRQQQPTTAAVGPLKWTVRQRRSRPPPQHGSSSKKPSRHLRASPTTPLSLSAGTSQDGSEESARAHARVGGVSCPARSEVNEDGEKAVSKKSRKRKTLAELKCEETSLAREGIELRMEIAALRVNLEKQWATNENLKKIKSQHQLIPDTRMPSSINPPRVITEADDASSLQHSSADSSPCKVFAIPDLNVPLEEDANTEMRCGVI